MRVCHGVPVTVGTGSVRSSVGRSTCRCRGSRRPCAGSRGYTCGPGPQTWWKRMRTVGTCLWIMHPHELVMRLKCRGDTKLLQRNSEKQSSRRMRCQSLKRTKGRPQTLSALGNCLSGAARILTANDI